MQLPRTIQVKGIRVLTSNQIAECYGTTPVRIKQNFNENRNRYVDGKHYISLTGDDLKVFKNQVGNSDLVASRTSHLYLWTEKGALLHAKSLNTDKAWEVYDYLVDFYFRAKEERKVPVAVPTYRELREAALAEKKQTSKPPMMTVVDVPENPQILAAIKKIKDDLTCMNVLLDNSVKYLSQAEYTDRIKSAMGIVSFLISDSNTLLGLKPKLIEKLY